MSLQPFVRWAGGKRWLAEQLAKEIEDAKPRVYVEPFLGGGAVALAVANSIPKVLADANPTLMDTWLCIQKMAPSLIKELRTVEQIYGNDQVGYVRARDALNSVIGNPRQMMVTRAALFLYLNARCFNGLWRTNGNGLFNVPFGKLLSPKSLTVDDLQPLSVWLRNCTIAAWDYKEAIYRAVVSSTAKYKGLAIYVDPPYHNTFTQYTKGDFAESDQRELAENLAYAARQGAKVWATNNDTPFIREIYSWARLDSIDEHHCVGATGDRRGKRACLLIRGG